MSCTFPELAVIGATPAAMAKAAALRNRPASPHSARSRTAVSEPMAQIAVRRVPQLCTNARDLPLDIEPASPWENGYIESFNGKLRDEPLNGEIFYTLREAEILVEHWRREYNHLRPHSSSAAPSGAGGDHLPRVLPQHFAPPALTQEAARALSYEVD